MHSSIVSYRGNFRRIHFECSIYQIRIESISRIFKNTIHSSRFECGNENSDISDVSSMRKSRYSRTYFNPTRLFIWKFFFPFGRFPRGCLELHESRSAPPFLQITTTNDDERKLVRMRRVNEKGHASTPLKNIFHGFRSKPPSSSGCELSNLRLV